jgi:hypothetical protein
MLITVWHADVLKGIVGECPHIGRFLIFNVLVPFEKLLHAGRTVLLLPHPSRVPPCVPIDHTLDCWREIRFVQKVAPLLTNNLLEGGWCCVWHNYTHNALHVGGGWNIHFY